MKRLPDSFAELLAPALAGLRAYQPEHADARVLLDANESPFTPSPAFRARVAAAAAGIDLNRYPDPDPQALKALLRRHFGAGPDAQVVLGNGSDELIGMLCTVFAGGGRTPRVAIPEPTFSMYRHIAEALGFEVVGIPLTEEFDLDVERFTRTLVRKPANLIFLASPNNPTGNAFDPDAIDWLIGNSGAIVVVDEAYGDYASVSFTSRVGRDPNLVVLKTLSKVGFAALRLGAALTSEAIGAELEKVRLPYNIGTFSERVAELYLRHPEEGRRHVRQVRTEREKLVGKMRELEDLEVFHSDANFVLFRPVRHDASSVHRALLKQGIRIRNLSKPSGPLRGCLRVTIGLPAQNRKFWRALQKALRQA